MEDLYYFHVANTKGIGIRTLQRLYEVFGSFENVCHSDVEGLMKKGMLKEEQAYAVIRKNLWERSRKQYERMRCNGIQYISFYSESFPDVLKNIYQPPKHLYVKGKMPENNKLSIGIVGARNCSIYGKDMARMFGACLARVGVQVVSGMAKGIDGWTHQGALEGAGETYAVLGCGVEQCYPASHEYLYRSIIKHGGVLSEFDPFIKAKPEFFPLRNRIISGLCDGVLVVEAREKSGSLITADYALEQGKDVFVIPGRIGDDLSKGCNNLIRQGAILVTSPEDILEYYGLKSSKTENISSIESEILNILKENPAYEVQILTQLNYAPKRIIQMLQQMKKNGQIRELGKGYFYI